MSGGVGRRRSDAQPAAIEEDVATRLDHRRDDHLLVDDEYLARHPDALLSRSRDYWDDEDYGGWEEWRSKLEGILEWPGHVQGHLLRLGHREDGAVLREGLRSTPDEAARGAGLSARGVDPGQDR